MKASGWLQSTIIKMDVTCCDGFSSSNVVSCAFSVLCIYSTFRHHPTFVPNFVCFTAPMLRQIQGDKSCIHSSHSLTQSPSLHGLYRHLNTFFQDFPGLARTKFQGFPRLKKTFFKDFPGYNPFTNMGYMRSIKCTYRIGVSALK